MSTAEPAGPEYVAARKVLLDALVALADHGSAVIVAGAQAVYLRSGPGSAGIAPYTTDGDLAIDPSLLVNEPALEAAMGGAGFRLRAPALGSTEPGIWDTFELVDGTEVRVSVDLIVPRGVGTPNRRGARLGPPHGKRAARQLHGLEAVLIDHGPMTIKALDPEDARAIVAEVAGPAALLVAKAHKLHDRTEAARAHRLKDKDAADVYRLMQTSRAGDVGATLAALRTNPVAGEATRAALTYLRELFARRGSVGTQMAVRALRVAIPEEQIVAVATAYVERLLAAADAP
jgi:hypothetical protein